MKKIIAILFILSGQYTFAQKNAEEVLLNTFDKTTAIYQERIFCHLNKQIFLKGESLWLQAYVLRAADKMASVLTSNVIAEIVNKEGQVLSRKTFFAEGGVAPGQFDLKNIGPGSYFVRVYTNWMRNFGEAGYFTTPISILAEKPGKIEPKSAKPYFSVHVEGGHVLANLEQKFVVIAEQQEQQLLSGLIKDLSGKVLQRFEVDKGEIPSFYFTPQTGQSYLLELSLAGGKTTKVEIPAPSEGGIGIALNPFFTDKVNVVLSANTTMPQQKSYIVIVHAEGKMYKALKVKLSNAQTVFELKQEGLAKGINTLTVFTEQGSPITERAFFVRADQRKGKLNVDVHQVVSKDSVVLKLQSPDQANGIRYSLSILPAATLAWKDQQSLFSYSFLDGQLPDHSYPSSSLAVASTFADLNTIDRLLIALGGRKFNWQWTEALSANTFPHEFERGFSITGSRVDHQVKKDAGKSTVDLYSSENNLMLNSKVDALGRFSFSQLFLLDSTRISLSVGTGKKGGGALTAHQQWGLESKDIGKTNFPMVYPLSEEITKLNLGDLIRQTKSISLKEVKVVSEKKAPQRSAIYQKGINDDSFMIDENSVKRFNSLIDLLRTKFMLDINDMGGGDIQIKMRGGMLGLNPGGGVQSNNPVIVIDGMVVNDLNYLRDLNIFDLEEVAVNKTGINLLGPSGSNGAIFLKTRTSPIDFSQVRELDPSDQQVQWIIAKGYTEARPFSSALFTAGLSYNNQLNAIAPVFWESGSIQAEGQKQVGFKLLWPCKEMIVIIEGIGKDGRLYSERKQLSIPPYSK